MRQPRCVDVSQIECRASWAIQLTGTDDQVDESFIVVDLTIVKHEYRALRRERIHLRKLYKHQSCESLATKNTTHHLFCNEIIEVESIQRPWNNSACNVTTNSDGCYKRVSVPSHKNISKNHILPRHCSTIMPCISVLVFACFINADKLQAITLEIGMQRLFPLLLEGLIMFNCQFVKTFSG